MPTLDNKLGDGTHSICRTSVLVGACALRASSRLNADHSRREYLAVVGSLVFVVLETLLRVVTLALRKSLSANLIPSADDVQRDLSSNSSMMALRLSSIFYHPVKGDGSGRKKRILSNTSLKPLTSSTYVPYMVIPPKSTLYKRPMDTYWGSTDLRRPEGKKRSE